MNYIKFKKIKKTTLSNSKKKKKKKKHPLNLNTEFHHEQPSLKMLNDSKILHFY